MTKSIGWLMVIPTCTMVLTGLAVWYLRRRLSRIERRQQQHRHIREDIVAAGVERRKRMCSSRWLMPACLASSLADPVRT